MVACILASTQPHLEFTWSRPPAACTLASRCAWLSQADEHGGRWLGYHDQTSNKIQGLTWNKIFSTCFFQQNPRAGLEQTILGYRKSLWRAGVRPSRCPRSQVAGTSIAQATESGRAGLVSGHTIADCQPTILTDP